MKKILFFMLVAGSGLLNASTLKVVNNTGGTLEVTAVLPGCPGNKATFLLQPGASNSIQHKCCMSAMIFKYSGGQGAKVLMAQGKSVIPNLSCQDNTFDVTIKNGKLVAELK